MKKESYAKGPQTFIQRQYWGIGRAAVWGTLLVVMATGLSFLGRAWWACDLFSHFRLQYTLALIPAVIWFGIFRRPRGFLLLALAALLVNAIPVARLYLPPRPNSDTRAEKADLRCMLINVNAANTDYAAVAEAINEADADVVVLEEITPEWVRGLSRHLTTYRFSHFQPRIDCFGIGLLSRIPHTRCDTATIGPVEIPSLIAHVPVGKHSLTVVGTHPLPPANGRYSRSRNGHLAALPAAMAELPQPLVLIGDLNVTPWSHHFSRLLADAGLCNSQQGFGLQRSWPAGRMLMGIPIDHLLHTPDIQIFDRRIGPAVGSDHHPLIVDLVLPKPPVESATAALESRAGEQVASPAAESSTP